MIDMPPEPSPRPEQVIEQRLVACGLDMAGLSVKYQDDLQSIEIVIGPGAGATSADFECIREASGHEIVTFEDPKMAAAYSDFGLELARPDILAELESTLRKRGLWDAFPARRAFGSLEDYAKALELHSRSLSGAALRVSGDAILFDPPPGERDHGQLNDQYADLLAVVLYAAMKERFKFGIIGNERVPE